MRKDTKDTAELEEPIEVDDLEVPMPMRRTSRTWRTTRTCSKTTTRTSARSRWSMISTKTTTR